MTCGYSTRVLVRAIIPRSRGKKDGMIKCVSQRRNGRQGYDDQMAIIYQVRHFWKVRCDESHLSQQLPPLPPQSPPGKPSAPPSRWTAPCRLSHTYGIVKCWGVFTLNYMHVVLQWNMNLQLENNFIRFQTHSDSPPLLPFSSVSMCVSIFTWWCDSPELPSGAGYLGYLRKYTGKFGTATRNRLLTFSSSLPACFPQLICSLTD